MTALDVVPMLRLPSSWPLVVNATVAMAALAVIDLVAAYAAKEWVLHRASSMLALGVVSMVLLFWVYASALQFAELSVVTFGWIVILQVGVVLLDRYRYGTEMPQGHGRPGLPGARVHLLTSEADQVASPGDHPRQHRRGRPGGCLDARRGCVCRPLTPDR